MGELKWKNIKKDGRLNVKRAKEAIDFVFLNISKDLRIDTLIWDINDARHSVEGRDDIANYCRMYFHLHRSLMSRRVSNARWYLHPDRLSRIDWDTIRNCLGSDGTWQRHIQSDPILFEDARWIAPQVLELNEVDSAKTPFVQLADLFAGMAAYTRTKPNVVKTLLTKMEETQQLFPEDVPTFFPNRTDRGRFRVISHLNQRCKQQRLGVSLKTHGYFCTYDPRKPINFWHYKPQHPHDRAPKKNRALSYRD